MLYDEERIKKIVVPFLRENISKLKFSYKGKSVQPKIRGFQILKLQKGDFGNGYNFEVTMIVKDVQIDNVINSKKAYFTIKVSFNVFLTDSVSNTRKEPKEEITDIKDSLIILKD